MRHKQIKKIRTRLHKQRQLVILELENDEFVFLSPANIKQNTTLEVNELELLVGSTIRIDFYKKGETMINGKACAKENLVVKEYFIELKKPVELLRVENADLLLPFQKIEDIFYFRKYERDNVGIKTNNGKVQFLSVPRFEALSLLKKSEQHILVGSYILPEYYKKGEPLTDGTGVAKYDNALKWLNLRYSGNIDSMHEQYENSVGYYADKDSNNDGSKAYGYDSWDEMAFNEAFEGDADVWGHYNQ